jgi:hypothetical protein
MLNWEDKEWIRAYLAWPKVVEMLEGWGKSKIGSIRIGIAMRRVILACEECDEPFDTDKDAVRTLMLGMHERGKELNTEEMEETIGLINEIIGCL